MQGLPLATQCHVIPLLLHETDLLFAIDHTDHVNPYLLFTRRVQPETAIRSAQIFFLALGFVTELPAFTVRCLH